MSNTKDRYEGIDRAPRENKTREKTAQRRPWAPPSMLDAPPAPEGLSSIAGFVLKCVVLMTAKTFQQDCVKVGNLFVVTNTLTLRHQ